MVGWMVVEFSTIYVEGTEVRKCGYVAVFRWDCANWFIYI
jgi:hypothetical protein